MINKYIYTSLGFISCGVIGLLISTLMNSQFYSRISLISFQFGFLMLFVPLTIGVFYEIRGNRKKERLNEHTGED